MKRSIKVSALLNMIKQSMQIIFPLITIPYISRTLLPDSYGKVNTGASLISYISLIAGLGIAGYAIREGALVRDDKKKLNDFSSQVFSINVLSTGISYIVLAIIIFGVPHYKNYGLLLSIQGVAVLFTTLGADWINSIEEDYLYLTIRYIVLHAVSLVMMFMFVKCPNDYYNYAAICLIASTGGNFLNLFYVRKYVKLKFTLKIDWKIHLIPILILFGNSIAMTIYVSSDITMLEWFAGTKEVGIYGVAAKIYNVIKQVLNAMLVVTVPRLTYLFGASRNEEFVKLGKNVLNALITLMIPSVIGIMMFSSKAISLAAGNEYLSGSTSLLILSLAVIPALIATFYSGCILMPKKMEKYIFKGTIISAFLNVALNLALIPMFGGDGAAFTTLISESYVAVYFWILVKKQGYSFVDGKVLLLSAIGGMLVGLTCIIIKKILGDSLEYMMISVAACVCLYSVVQIIGKNPLINVLVHRRR